MYQSTKTGRQVATGGEFRQSANTHLSVEDNTLPFEGKDKQVICRKETPCKTIICCHTNMVEPEMQRWAHSNTKNFRIKQEQRI